VKEVVQYHTTDVSWYNCLWIREYKLNTSQSLIALYHVSCVEQILDLSTLLESKQLLHDWGLALQGSLFGVSTCCYPIHIAIDD
jgi:hypothetical protein